MPILSPPSFDKIALLAHAGNISAGANITITFDFSKYDVFELEALLICDATNNLMNTMNITFAGVAAGLYSYQGDVNINGVYTGVVPVSFVNQLVLNSLAGNLSGGAFSALNVQVRRSAQSGFYAVDATMTGFLSGASMKQQRLAGWINSNTAFTALTLTANTGNFAAQTTYDVWGRGK